ncbi:TRAP transporter small permease [Alcaligenes ammonioxydans]|uniref:TRAP transporter small permease protein n=1 Tax=Alcaligenes ammonioxydans TaxID=2582914 RepID=A0ABX8SNN9_9BURK|nr:TRAP transporter small permease [Alcaligenes ammonioxydans]MCH1880063.1 TRAP transporter small permease [Alcaligenes ammonioxydans]QBH19631.1 TRAP transporter small permease [Alcaligenes faecalis]QXX77642.1 TRAP transporter small permease [Alcaligenes ammonioxydans]HRK86447.1 TRAP transporter small permease [Alcaligenes faecalis]
MDSSSTDISTHPASAPTEPGPRVPLQLEDWASVLIMATLALITFANVFVRYLTDSSFAWTEEISIFLLVVLTMNAGASACVRHLHIRIEVFADAGTQRRQRRLALFGIGMSLLFFIGLAVLSGRMALDEFEWGDTSPSIGVPTWWYSMWLPILSTTLSLRLLGMWMRRWRAKS